MEQYELENYIDDFKKKHLENIQLLMRNQGGLVPMIAVLCYDIKEQEPMVMMVPIMTKDFQEEDKDKVINKIIPALFAEMKIKNKKPLCFSFSSEAWLRTMNDPGDDIPENWKDLPKTEGLFTTFETKEYSEIHCSTMSRVGKQVNDDGDLVDQIELVPFEMGEQGNQSRLRGRFGDIFKKYG